MLPGLLDRFRPDLVLYDAGIDPHKGDALGRLALTDEGLHRRELLVSSRATLDSRPAELPPAWHPARTPAKCRA